MTENLRNMDNEVTTNIENEQEERRNFLSIIAAFKFYRTNSICRVNKTEGFLNTLSPKHQEMLHQYRMHLRQIRDCIDCNYKVIRKIIEDVDNLFDNGLNSSLNDSDEKHIVEVSSQDMENVTAHIYFIYIAVNTFLPVLYFNKKSSMEKYHREPVELFKLLKVQVTLKQFARDWSADGEEEREQCYKPIINAIMEFYRPEDVDVSSIKVLVPGAGLGRLAYELACRGYFCEGNEFSYFMLIASNFVLNRCALPKQYTLFPWIHQFVNNSRRQDQVTPIEFPDVSPIQEPPSGPFNMVAGDFLQVYTQENHWDCVATCFFIDCANNVVDFVENIYKILKPGAIWVNLGPLLYHYSDVASEDSIEPTYEDLVFIIKSVGFEILTNQKDVRTKYAQNPRSMQQSEYLSVFFVCQKPNEETDDINNENNHHPPHNEYDLSDNDIELN